MPVTVSNMNMGVQQSSVGDLTTTGNLVLGSGKSITAGGTTVFGSDGKVDWTLLKNTPFLFYPPSTPALPTTSDQSLGDETYTWVADVAQIAAMSGINTSAKTDGYLLMNTRSSTDSALMPRLRVDNVLTTYGNLLPNANNTLDLGSSAMGFRNGYFASTVQRVVPVLAKYNSANQSVANATNTTVSFDTTDANNSVGSTGLTYSAGQFTNSTGRTLTLLVTYSLRWQTNSTGYRWCAIQVSPQNGQYGAQELPANTGDALIAAGSAVLALANNASFSIACYQNSGSSVALQSTNTSIQVTLV